MDPETENLPPRLSILGAALWTFAVTMVLGLIVGISESMRPGAKADLVTLTGASFIGYLLIFFAILRVYLPQTSVRSALGLRAFEGAQKFSRSLSGIALAALLGFGLFLLASPLEALLAKVIPAAAGSNDDLVAPLLEATTLGRKVILVASTALVLPVLVELFFRGMLYGRLEEAGGPRHAVVVTATLATAFHAQADVRFFPIILVINFILSVLRAATGGVLIPSVVAILYMAPSSLMIALGRGETVLPWSYAWRGGVLACLALLALLQLSRRSSSETPLSEPSTP